MTKRTLGVLTTLVLVVAACNGDDSADPTTTPAVTTPPDTTTAPSTSAPPTTEPSITAPTTTAPPSTTDPPPSTTAPSSTVESTAPPSTTPIDEIDWRAVIEMLGRRRQELYQNPDLSRIGEVCASESPCAEQLDVQLGDMASKGWHIEGGDPYTVLEAELEAFTGDTLEESLVVTIVEVVQRPDDAGQIVDSSGAVVAEVTSSTEEGMNSRGRTILGIAGPPDDPWRIIDQEDIGEVP